MKAKILAKATTSTTGLTDEVAQQVAARGRPFIAIVELNPVRRVESISGDADDLVQIQIASIEPVLDERADEAVRRIQRALYVNRAEADGQAAIDESLGDEPALGDALDQGLAALDDGDVD